MRYWGIWLAILFSAVGCADIRLGPPKHANETLGTTTHQRVVPDEVAPDFSEDNRSVTTLKVCESVPVTEIERTTTKEWYNDTPGQTWTKAVLGVAGVGVGTVLLVDAENVYPNDTTSRTYNDTGQDTAYVYAVSMLAAGVALGTWALVDVIQAQGREVEVTKLTEKGEPTGRAPCLGKPAADVEVFAIPREGSREAQRLGKTNFDGQFKIDLDAQLPSSYLWPSTKLKIVVAGEEVSVVDATDVFHAREKTAWLKLEKRRCKEPEDSGDCDHIVEFMRQYPGGLHYDEAQALLDAAKPKLATIKDDEAWASIPEGAEKRCIEASQMPRNSNDTCSPFLGYQEAYPDGRHTDEAEAVLAKAEKAAATREAEALAAAKREEAARAAAQRRLESEEKRQCLAECNMGCTGRTVEDKAMCSSGCSLRCGGQECEGSCAIGCSSWKVDQHQTCFANCKAAQCSGGL